MKPVCALLLLFGVAAQARPSETMTNVDPSLDEADFVPVEWEVEVSPGGDWVTLHGTVEQVVEQLRELNPNWDTDYPEVEESEVNTFEAVGSGQGESALEKRTDFSGSEYGCSGTLAQVAFIRGGITYLRRINGKPGMANNRCGRVSCSWGSGISWCNRSGGWKTLNSYGSIADGAAYILPRCYSDYRGVVRGWVKHKTGWNVKVHQADC